MVDNQLFDDGGDDDIFVYMGGEQEVPRDVRRAKIDESIDTIPRYAFRYCAQLIEVEGHNKLKKIERWAFTTCLSLRWLMKMGGVKEIEEYAFYDCHALSELEFGKLEIIGDGSFINCESLRSINLPSVKRVGRSAFQTCAALTEAVFGKDLEGIERRAFWGCPALRRIAIPLKDGLIIEDDAFDWCGNLSRVDALVGGIHKTISSLYMESWKTEMKKEIDRIHQILPDTQSAAKGAAIQEWVESLHPKTEHYKSEHRLLVKEAMTLLELALWKAKLLNEEGMQCVTEEEKKSKKAKMDKESSRKEHRVTCGANIVIKNVLPFLALKK